MDGPQACTRRFSPARGGGEHVVGKDPERPDVHRPVRIPAVGSVGNGESCGISGNVPPLNVEKMTGEMQSGNTIPGDRPQNPCADCVVVEGC